MREKLKSKDNIRLGTRTCAAMFCGIPNMHIRKGTLLLPTTVNWKVFNFPLLPCLKLQAAWLKRFYCFVLAFALLRLLNLKLDQNS